MRARGGNLLALLIPSYGIMRLFGEGDGTFARICWLPTYLPWAIPWESDLLVFKEDRDWVPDRPESLSME